MPTKIAFFDRDGVLNVDHNYVHRPDQFDWMPEAREAIKWLNDHSIIVAVATNQSGIARAIYSEADFAHLSNWMRSDLATIGAKIDAIYHCPHFPDEGCECRKPKPGMLLQGMREFGANPDDCFFIGDKETDMGAAKSAGMTGIPYAGGSLLEIVRRSALIER